MSWIPEERYQYSWWQNILVRLLRCGRIPHHVAFIMDGNRRYARQRNMDKIQGHVQGFEKLAETLQWCHDLGINQVTVYAFSIENYKRPQSEVDSLLNLARDKFRRLIHEVDRFNDAGVRVNVIGNLALLPEDLRDLIDEATALTRSNTKAILNVAFSYTSREEMTSAVKTLGAAVADGRLEPDDIDADLLERCLYTSLSPDRPELLIRTSGEVRLSDFLLWQSSYSVTHFTNVLWPDFALHHLLGAIFRYQNKMFHVSQLLEDDFDHAEQEICEPQEEARNYRVAEFVRSLECDKSLEKQYGCTNCPNTAAKGS